MRVCTTAGLALGLWGTAAAQEVWINELVADPAGPDGGAEWLELSATTDTPLGGWAVEAATQPDRWARVVTLPDTTHILAGEHLVIAGPDAAVGDAAVLRLPFDAAVGNAGTDADALRLVDAGGWVIDVFAYGPEAARLFADATAHGPAPSTGGALARVPDGARHVEDTEPTPGLANPAPTLCVPGRPGSVRLTELQPDPDGADAGAEWVELVASVARDLSGWSVEQASAPADWGRRVRFTFPEGAGVDAGERAVIADDEAEVDTRWRLARGSTLGLGNAADAVRLVDCGGRPIDTVLYGDLNTDGFAEDDGTVPPDAAPAPDSGGCLARLPDGVDSDRSAADWGSVGRCSPGAPNDGVAGEAPPSGPPPGAGCGAPATSRPGGGCAHAAPRGGLWTLALCAIVRRRAGRSVAR